MIMTEIGKRMNYEKKKIQETIFCEWTDRAAMEGNNNTQDKYNKQHDERKRD